MAYIERKYCIDHDMSFFADGVCMRCTEKANREQLRREVAGWDSLSINDKLNYLFYRVIKGKL